MKETILITKKENLNFLLLKIEKFLEKKEISIKSKLRLELIIEEIFINICSYAYEKEGAIKVQYDFLEDSSGIIIKFIDNGIEFNPLKKNKPNLDLTIDEKEIGGLGLTLIRNNVDKIDYEYENNQNILSIVYTF